MRVNSKTDCFCALCRSPRVIRYSKNLQARHYLQILLLVVAFSFSTFSFFGLKVLYSIPLIWGMFEITHKMLYRKDVKCQYCGFDPTWYKKDIKVARAQVEQFLKQNPNSPVLQRVKRSQEIFENHHRQ